MEARRTPVFDQESVPAGLLRAHTTRADTWGRIDILEGRLLYRILEPEREELWLDASRPGVIEPGVRHEVALPETVRFQVVFLRAPESS